MANIFTNYRPERKSLIRNSISQVTRLVLTIRITFQQRTAAKRPGCVLECYARDPENDNASPQCLSNSGILITRGGTNRLTCALHTWDGVSPKKAYHAGVYIGDIDKSLGEDIGLVNPVVPVSNEFLEIKTKVRNLIRAEDIGDHDLVCVDSCFTGPQTLQSAGSRWGKRFMRGEGGTSYLNMYVVLEQRIFTASTPFVPTPPFVPLGMCGTPLLRVENALDSSVTAERGDILGFFYGMISNPIPDLPYSAMRKAAIH